MVAEHEKVALNLRQVGDSQHNADGVQDVGFAAAIPVMAVDDRFLSPPDTCE